MLNQFITDQTNMLRAILLTFLLIGYMPSRGQNISLNFTGAGVATQVDSVTDTNLSTHQSITLPGNETLVLTFNTGISADSGSVNAGMVIPNPFSSVANFTVMVPGPQTVYIQVTDLAGQIIAETSAHVQPGENRFDLSLAKAGTYLISLDTEQGRTTYKTVCTENSETVNNIRYCGTTSGQGKSQLPSIVKTSQASYTLDFNENDIIHFKCYSNMYTSILIDSPLNSTTYTVDFTVCSDADGRNYPVIQYRTQTWMAENLAYLPAISPSMTGSDDQKNYYVYGYEGSNVNSAKQSSSYRMYGVLYNWEAAKVSCPDGWRLPTDEEWNSLSGYLSASGCGYGGTGNDIGKSMASTTGWIPSTVAGTIGNDQASNNSSAFAAFPSGNRNDNGGFFRQGSYTFFWSSTENGPLAAWGRYLYNTNDGLNRLNGDRSNGFSVRCVRKQ
jgi:uncharacterized protein (TIGR02145 family)